MAHGLTITGANNTFTIDSTISGAAALPVVLTAGTVTSGNSYTGYALGDIVFAKPTAGYGVISSDFRNPSAPVAKSSQTYILVRPASSVTATDLNGPGDHGLQVFDEDGSTIMYDSRQTASGFDIKATKAFQNCPGARPVQGYLTDNVVYDSYTSATYVCINSVYDHDAWTSFDVIIGFDFRQNTTNIYYVGYWSGWSQSGAIANMAELIVGNLIT